VQHALAMQGGNLGVQQHLDTGLPLDPLCEILRHVLGKAILAQDHDDVGRVAGEVQRPLGRRVAAADHDHLLAAAKLGFASPGAVVDACSEQSILVRQVQASIGDPGGADRGVRDDLRAVGQIADALAGLELAAHTLAQQQDLGAEAAPARFWATRGVSRRQPRRAPAEASPAQPPRGRSRPESRPCIPRYLPSPPPADRRAGNVSGGRRDAR
jgi:hypothetical protein